MYPALLCANRAFVFPLTLPRTPSVGLVRPRSRRWSTSPASPDARLDARMPRAHVLDLAAEEQFYLLWPVARLLMIPAA